MPWNTDEIKKDLSAALNAFNWSEVEKICNDLIGEIYRTDEIFPEEDAKKILSALRRKQCFDLMSSVAGAFVRSGSNSLQILRQYAQSLIDRGNLTAPEFILNFIIANSESSPDENIKRENFEARGLIGRIYKQLYVNSDAHDTARSRSNLQKAFEAYYDVYKSATGEIWHGVNAVAIIKRAQRDKIALAGAPNPNQLAIEIIETIDEREKNSIEKRKTLTAAELAGLPEDPLDPWDIATKIEALIATADYTLAEEAAFRYAAHQWSDAFEINSTLRQLKEVWKLTDKNSPGANILSILEASHLQKRGASTIVSTESVGEKQIKVQQAFDELEAKFGDSKSRPLLWLKTGLKRCESIARIERLDGKGHGTGWLVDGGSFFTGQEGQLMVLTNHHVISPAPAYPRALLPNQAQVHFEVHGEIFQIKSIFWTSDVGEYDATFLLIDGEPSAEPLPLFEESVILGEPPPPRLFVIGHPGGRDLEFSLEDNLLIGATEKLLHYRAPTEKGSSGSPVFDEFGWQVVALHHAGGNHMKKLDNPNDFYEANEGITIRAIRQQTKQFVPSN
ncbi:MAG TPA: serine protease [Pyrinomonadaceae bacterium]|jgi:hypothetical protein